MPQTTKAAAQGANAQKFSANLPSFAMIWLGGFRGVELHKMAQGVWLFSGPERALFVSAQQAPDARRAARRFVSFVDPKTDKRRSHWFYT